MDSSESKIEKKEAHNIDEEKYKELVEEYERDLKRIISDYENLKRESMEVQLSAKKVKRDMQEIVENYNFIKREYTSLQEEFLSIVELSQEDPELCLKLLRDYSDRMNNQKIHNEVQDLKPNNFRIIEGGKRD